MGKFATVWRIETPTGTGMYTVDGLGEIVREAGLCQDGPEHPAPHNDIALDWPSALYYFGFASLSQMRQWVYKPAWRRALSERGFVLVKYRVPVDCFRRSQYQACFYKRKAKRVETRRVDYSDKLKGA